VSRTDEEESVLKALFDTAYDLRQAIEDFMIGTRSNIKRRRKIKNLKEQVHKLRQLQSKAINNLTK
jgi:hypothetical protein